MSSLVRRAWRAIPARPVWLIDRRFDLRLSTIGDRFKVPVDQLERFTKRQVDLAWKRVRCVEEFRKARATWKGAQRDWLNSLVSELRIQNPTLKISCRSLRRWNALYANPAAVVRLCDARGGNQCGPADPAAWQRYRDYYLDERQPTKKTCWRRVKELAAAEGWTWCSYQSCVRQIDDRIPPAIQAKYRNPREYRDHYSPFIKMGADAWPAGLMWIGDHGQSDVWCLAGGEIIRPFLTIWQDHRSRKVVGWILAPVPSSSTILAALRIGIIDESNLGGPDGVYIDNGKDYSGYTFHGSTKSQRRKQFLGKGYIDEAVTEGLFGLLQISATFATPFNPRAKGRLERLFGTLHDQVDKTMPTYAGSSTATRPESLKRILKRRHLIPTLEHLADRYGDFFRGFNESPSNIEDLEGLSPAGYYATHCPRRRQMADPAVLDLLMQQWHKPVRVGRNGVTIKPLGKAISYGQHALELVPYKAAKAADRPYVRVSFDPQQMGRVRVYDMDWRFICEASMNHVGQAAGDQIGREDLAEAMRDQRRYAKAQRVQRTHHEVEYLSTMELAADAAQERIAAENPPDVKLVQTPLDGQSKSVQTDKLAKAVGAEDLDETPHLLDGLELLGGGNALEMLAQHARDLHESDEDEEFGCHLLDLPLDDSSDD